MRMIVATLLFGAGLLGSASAQDRAPGTDPLATGIQQLEGGDLESAVQTLGMAVRQLGGDKQRSKDLALAHVYLAMAQLGLDDPAAARQSMTQALSVDRDLKLDAKRFPPRVRQLHEEAKVAMRQATRPAAVTSSAPPPPRAPTAVAPARQRPPMAAPRPSIGVPVGVPVGARVRVAAPATGNKTVVGTVVRADGETIVIERESSREGVSIPAASLTRLDVSKGSRTKSFKVGLLAGVLGGAAVGAAYGNGCTYDYQSDFEDRCYEKKGIGKWAAIGGAGGALIGGLVGKLSGKEHWEAVARRQVSIAPLGLRGAQVAVRF